MQDLKEQTPLGRIGKAEEVAELISFLCSNKADFITGQVVTCDGGFSL
jgi:3-oxoacyl-[acyl-carrier protein] reductase